MNPLPRLMIIIWAWSDKNNVDLPLDLQTEDRMNIDGCPNDALYRFDPGVLNLEIAEDYLAKTIAEHSTTHQIQIFLHRNHGFTRTFVEGIKPPKNSSLNINIFGAGDHIYINLPHSPHGLLTRSGNMQGTINGLLYSSIITKEGKKFVKKQHFNSVWNYYQHLIKNKTAVLMEDLVRLYCPAFCFPAFNVDSHAALNWESHALKLAQKFKNITDQPGVTTTLSDKDDDKIQSSFYSKEITETAQNLSTSIYDFIETRKKTKITSKNVTLLRESFIKLLNAMPEKAYV